MPTKILGDPEELDRHLLQNGYTETLTRQTAVFDAYNDNIIYRDQQDIEIHVIFLFSFFKCDYACQQESAAENSSRSISEL